MEGFLIWGSYPRISYWGFHTVRGGITPGESNVVGAVPIWTMEGIMIQG